MNTLSRQETNILLIDDEVDIAELLAEELGERGFCVVVKNNANDGIEFLKSNMVDIILCDYKMPGKSGLDVLSEAKKLEKAPLFYLVTGQCDIEENHAKDLGIKRCIDKPFDLFALIETIESDYVEEKQSSFDRP